MFHLENSPRLGSDIDVRNLKNMFLELGYETKIWEDIDIHDLKEKMRGLREILLRGEYGCLFFFVLSHGSQTRIYLEKCKKGHRKCRFTRNRKRSISRKFLNKFFEGNNVIRNMAKIFLMNNCRSEGTFSRWLNSFSRQIFHLEERNTQTCYSTSRGDLKFLF